MNELLDLPYNRQVFYESKFSNIPIKLLLTIAISVFLTQIVSILIFSFFSMKSFLLWSVFNVTFLIVFIFSSLYCFCFLPLVNKVISLIKENEVLGNKYVELQQTFENISVGVCVIDANYKIVYFNQEFVLMCGLNAENIINKKCYEIFPGEFCHTDFCSIRRTLFVNDRFMFKENKIRMDGKKVPCIINVSPLLNHRGEFVGIMEELKHMPVSN